MNVTHVLEFDDARASIVSRRLMDSDLMFRRATALALDWSSEYEHVSQIAAVESVGNWWQSRLGVVSSDRPIHMRDRGVHLAGLGSSHGPSRRVRVAFALSERRAVPLTC